MLRSNSFEKKVRFQRDKIMHSLDQNPQTIPAFILKLWKLVEDETCNDLISWSEKGNSFILREQAKFARELLPKYFKHNNMASFIRQLNMYGFRKAINYEKCGLSTADSDEMEFHHAFFMKSSENLLELIKRKMPSKSPELNSHPKDILSDLSVIHEKQASMDSMLIGMKKENELLWRELSSLRQKHKAQEQIIQKVIHFLVSIVQSSKQNIGVKRKITHMLQDSNTTSTKRSRGLVDVVRGKATDFFFSQVSDDDKATSPVGPVIHEVTDFDHEDSMDIERSTSVSSRSKHKQNETVAQIQSPLNCSSNVASPADSLNLLEPASSRTSLLPYEEVEEVLGLPVDYLSTAIVSDDIHNPVSSAKNISNVVSTTNDISNVISIPDVGDRTQLFDLLISNPVGNVISIPEVSKKTTITPNCDGNNSKSDFKNQSIILCNDIPFSPSMISLINEDSGASSHNSNLKPPEVSSAKILDQDKSIHSSSIKVEGKSKSCMKSGQNSSKRDVIRSKKIENQENAMQNNFQLTLSDINSAELAKNTFTNHVLNVDQDIDWLQEELNSGTFDSSMLLGDDIGVLRDTDSNIIGNELVQIAPSSLDLCFDDADLENPILSAYLNESTDDMNTNLSNFVKSPTPIKQERIAGTSSCIFENSPSKGRKNSRSRGKLKSK